MEGNRADIIDLSSHNGIVDFNKMASRGISKVIIRATWRLSGLDNLFVTNYFGAKDAGMEVGAYHLWDSRYDGIKQAEWFLGNVQEFNINYAALDVEETMMRYKIHMGHMHNWLWDVSCALGTNTMVYTSAGLWSDYQNSGPVPWAWNFPLWVADYDSAQPDLPTDWDTWYLWQHSGDGNGWGSYYGTQSGSVDLNIRNW